MSQSAYSSSRRFSPTEVIAALREFAAQTNHQFWPDNLSLRDPRLFASDRIHSSRQITDLYLLALAAANHGRLATFDQGIPLSAVLNAQPTNLCVS